jgi:dTMP kinase
MHGRLVVFEGAEGTGKSTQIGLLMDALSAVGVAAATFREPGGTDTGDAIRRLLLDPVARISAATEAHLFMASRAELCAREIRPALERGLTVVLDRFFLSTYAYQVVGRGLPEEEIRAANRLATGGLVPDLTLLLDLPAGSGLARATARSAPDRIEQAAGDFHARVSGAFRDFAEPAWVDAHTEAGPIVAVDGHGSREDVFSRVVDVLVSRLPGEFGVLRRRAAVAGSAQGD